MQALILAAGYSKRLKELTKDVPKSFLEIDNKKIIEHHLDKISEVGITKATIVVGFQKSLFYSEIGKKYKNISIEYVECDEYMEFNHGWSFFLSNSQIKQNKEDVLVVHADTFYGIEMLEQLLENDSRNLLLADSQYNNKTNDELLVYGQDGLVSSTRFSYENKGTSTGEFIGLHKFDFETYAKFIKYLDKFKWKKDRLR